MAKNTIYYGFTQPPATGGDFVSLDHIRALIRLGFDARAYYGAPDDGHKKFPVPVSGPRAFQPDDILVMGEVHSFAAARAIPAVKVMHAARSLSDVLWHRERRGAERLFACAYPGAVGFHRRQAGGDGRGKVHSSHSPRAAGQSGARPEKTSDRLCSNQARAGGALPAILFRRHGARICPCPVGEAARAFPRGLYGGYGRIRHLCRAAATGRVGIDVAGSDGVGLPCGRLYRQWRRGICARR